MDANVQIRAWGRCPKCGGKFARIFKGKGHEVCQDCEYEFPPAYYIDFYYQGRRIRIFRDDRGQILDSPRRAVHFADKIKLELEDHVFDPAKYVNAEAIKYFTSELLDEFLKRKLKEIAPAYYSNYKTIVNSAKAFFATKDVRDIRKRDLIGYKDHLEQSKRKEKTIKNYLSLIKTFFNWCRAEMEIIQTIPNFPEIHFPEPKRKWLSLEDQIKLLKHVPDDDKPIIRFLMLQGCRPGEARALRVSDVDLRNESIFIGATFSGSILHERRKGKRARAVVVPIHPEMLPYIRERVKNNLPGAWLFTNKKTGGPYSIPKLRKIWDGVKAGAGIKDLTLYEATRHSFASNLLSGGASLFQIGQLMGHRDTRTTEKYSHGSLESQRTTLKMLSLDKVRTVNYGQLGKKAVSKSLKS